MKVLVVSKPVYNYYLPLVDFPVNKDVFNIDKTLESIYGEANVAAYLLAQYGMEVVYSGITGKDEAGDKFRKILEDNHIDTKFMELDFENNTDVNYSIIKTEKTPGFACIKVNSMKKDLTKYKYDFTPEFIVFDDKDFAGANAVLNNYPNATTIFYGKKPSKDAFNMCKRSKYVVCNIEFASKLTGLQIELNKPKTIVNLYQKLIDLYKCEWVITLGEHGVIYCNDMQVKMIPGIPTEVVDQDKAGSIFFGTFAYSIINGIDIEESVRLANINASNSLKVIGAMNGFLDKDTLLSYRVQKAEQLTENTNTTQTQPSQESVATDNVVVPEQNASTNAPVQSPETNTTAPMQSTETNVEQLTNVQETANAVVNPNPNEVNNNQNVQ